MELTVLYPCLTGIIAYCVWFIYLTLGIVNGLIARNKLRWGKDKTQFAKPEYEQWWKFWEEEGWVSLGRLKNYDWMHAQSARR